MNNFSPKQVNSSTGMSTKTEERMKSVLIASGLILASVVVLGSLVISNYAEVATIYLSVL